MTKTLTFYTNPQSRGRVVRWMLEEAGADYETKVIDYGPAMKTAPYIDINPMGKVPAIRHGDKVVTECAAICAYLADAFPDAGLAPALDDRAAYYRWLFFAAGPLESAVTNRSLGWEPPEDKQMTAGYGNFDLTRDTLIKAVSNTPYITGDTFTAADVYVGAHINFCLQFGTLPTSPELEAYRDRVTARDAFKRATDLDNALMPET